MPAVIGDDFWEAAGAAYQNSVGAGFHRYHQRKREKVADQRYEQEFGLAQQRADQQTFYQNERLKYEAQRAEAAQGSRGDAQAAREQAAADKKAAAAQEQQALGAAGQFLTGGFAAQRRVGGDDWEGLARERAGLIAQTLPPEHQGMFTQRFEQAISGHRKKLAKEQLPDTIARLGADPMVASDPLLSRRWMKLQELAAAPDADPEHLHKAALGLAAEGDELAVSQANAQEYLSQIEADSSELTAAADALKRQGRTKDANRLYAAVREARAHAVRIQRDPRKAADHFGSAIKALGASAGGEEEEGGKPLSFEEAYRLAANSFSELQRSPDKIRALAKDLMEESRGVRAAPGMGATPKPLGGARQPGSRDGRLGERERHILATEGSAGLAPDAPLTSEERAYVLYLKQQGVADEQIESEILSRRGGK